MVSPNLVMIALHELGLGGGGVRSVRRREKYRIMTQAGHIQEGICTHEIVLKCPQLDDLSTTASAAGIERWTRATSGIQLNSGRHSTSSDNSIHSD
jgi:hypothetical protein